jgi:hypothetical protein
MTRLKTDSASAKVILDLCGGSGAWSKPYRDDPAYRVITVDVKRGGDIRLFRKPPFPVYGILAAPPCTSFAVSGSQYWKAKDASGDTLAGLAVVDACLRIVTVTRPRFWALENPVGRLKYWLGNPKMYFNPCDFGDPYTKKTCLWGHFNRPVKCPVAPVRACDQGSWIQRLGGKSEKTKTLRSITPAGFAKAFKDANP